MSSCPVHRRCNPRRLARAQHRRLTRRSVLLGAGGGLLLTACGSSGTNDERTTGVDQTATTGPARGDLQSSVLVLDEIAALAVLSLGVTPRSVDPIFGYGAAGELFRGLGVQLGAPPPADGRSVESIAAANPSAIVGISIPSTVALLPQLEQLAPSVAIDFTASWEEQIRQVAELFGLQERAEQVVLEAEAAVAALAADLRTASLVGTSVSVLASGADGNLFALARSGLVSELLAEVGLTRPVAQDVETSPTAPFVDISAERLVEHDADHLIILAGPTYPTEPIVGNPLDGQLGAVSRHAATTALGEIWFAASAFSLHWIIEDLRAVLLSEGEVGTEAAMLTRWAQFRG